VQAPTDEQLLEEYLQGKTASFELLVRRHASELYQFAVRFTGDAMAAEDVVQETFLQVHHSAGDFDRSRRFKPWLFTIAANKARDHLRRLSRRREVSFEAQIGNDSEIG
jgi:RNA polymerase sigma-70 factor (ECF subfamily)